MQNKQALNECVIILYRSLESIKQKILEVTTYTFE